MNAATLPSDLQPAWEEIRASEERIAEALAAGDLAVLEPMATRRHAQILEFFARFPLAPDSATLRLELLRTLTARNEAMLGDSRTRLAAVAGLSAQARHNRRALRAYAGQDG